MHCRLGNNTRDGSIKQECLKQKRIAEWESCASWSQESTWTNLGPVSCKSCKAFCQESMALIVLLKEILLAKLCLWQPWKIFTASLHVNCLPAALIAVLPLTSLAWIPTSPICRSSFRAWTTGSPARCFGGVRRSLSYSLSCSLSS